MSKPIAVIGIGAIFPEAMDLSEYWSNILAGKDCIKDIPPNYWEFDDFYDPVRTGRDKTYGKRAGTIHAISFDSLEYGIPPKVMESIAVDQLFALVVARQALLDANLIGIGAKPYDEDKTGVIVAASLGKTAFSLNNRLQAPKIKRIMENSGVPSALVETVIDRLKNCEVEWDENCNPGYLSNVVSGRIANRFNFYGTNCSVDAACASSLAALKFAVSELESGDCDIMLTGGVNLDCTAFSFVSFSKTPAISKSNISRPFDKNADGMLLGDGVGMIVLKRLEDTVKDEDRIYGVIQSVGSSGDGRAKGIFTPMVVGQIKALERSYEKCHIDPATVTLIEAHGTGTAVGDGCEVEALTSYFGKHGARKNSIALGSVKGQIGHTRLSAGIAGMIKVLMALYHNVLPPTINVEEPNEKIYDSPLYLPEKAKPWFVNKNNPVRRAGVSAFGFGGTNFHVVLEEYKNDTYVRVNQTPVSIFIADSDKENLMNKCEKYYLNSIKDNGDSKKIFDKLVRDSKKNIPGNYARIGIVLQGPEELPDKLKDAIHQLKNHSEAEWQGKGIYYRNQGIDKSTKVVTLFSGQGAQYSHMFAEIAQNYPEMLTMCESVDNAMIDAGDLPITEILYPIAKNAVDAEKKLVDTRYTQPALAAVCGGLYKILWNRGYREDYVIGHSFGEITALWAGGAMSDETYALLAVKRGHFMSDPQDKKNKGTSMIAVAAAKHSVEEITRKYKDLYLANENSQKQIVVSGKEDQIDMLKAELDTKKILAKKLNVSAAFHSPFMETASNKFDAIIDESTFRALSKKVISNKTTSVYDYEQGKIKDNLKGQIISPVLFMQSVNKAYQEGGRIFVEVGPKKVLGKLVDTILKDKQHWTITVDDGRTGGGLAQLENAFAQLKVLGLAISEDRYSAYHKPNHDDYVPKSSYMVEPTMYYTPEKKLLNEQAEFSVEKREEVEKPIVNDNRQVIKTVIVPEENVMDDSMGDDEMDKNNTLVNLQNFNREALESFLKSQDEQLSAANTFLKNVEKPDEKENAYRFLEMFQKNSMMAYEAYMNSQSSIFTTVDENKVTNVWPETKEKPRLPKQKDEPAVSLPESPPVTPSALPANKAQAESSNKAQAESSNKAQAQLPNRAQAESSNKPQSESPVVAGKQGNKDVLKGNNHFNKLVVGIVSQVTGYPEEMIDVKMNLEADLGIDSIKRVEIFSLLSDQLEDGFSQEDVETMAMFFTIEDISSYIGKKFQVTESIAEDPVEDVSNCTNEIAVKSPDEESQGKFDDNTGNYDNMLIDIISEKTGYPQSMIDINMNMEADLGIDSIKRVEIFSSLSEVLESGFSQEDIENMATLYTIKDIGDYLKKKIRGHANAVDSEGERYIKRFEVSLKTLDKKSAADVNIMNHGLVIVTVDDSGMAGLIKDKLQGKGYQVRLIGLPGSNAKKTDVSYRIESPDEKGVKNVMDKIMDEGSGPLAGLIHLSSVGETIDNLADIFDYEEIERLKTVFLLAKYFRIHTSEVAGDKKFFVSVSRMDGYLGVGDSFGGKALQGSLFGLIKSLVQEWADVYCKAMDIARDIPKEKAAEYVMQEVFQSAADVIELGIDAKGKRSGLVLTERYPNTPDARVPNENDVFLVLGGGRGITAECVLRLAEYKSRFILLGRTKIDEDISWAGNGNDKKELKKILLEKCMREGKAVKPAEIDRLLKTVLSQIEIKNTVQEIERLGGKAVYRPCDVTDVESLKGIIKESQAMWGDITGLIHGAGNIADKKIQRKTEDDFNNVYGTKIFGLEACIKLLDMNKLKYFILFSSISAYFGSGGQTDYSMANEMLNKFAYGFKKTYPDCKMIAINWGPWDGGMVGETMRMVFRAAGVKIIPIESGTSIFLDLFKYYQSDICQVIINGDDFMTMPSAGVDISHAALLHNKKGV